MKIVQSDRAKIVVNSDTSKLLEYSIELNDKDVDFCINTINGRYPEKDIAPMKNVKKYAMY